MIMSAVPHETALLSEPPTPALPVLLTYTQVADYLGVHTRTVTRLVASGELTAVCLSGGTRRITESAVVEMLERAEVAR
ncbi:excisionase family DNA binding protein [Serinibacter salmoneus]|uniref:Excisionase family DNA binding protein n=2 Tax=Serinibacter salmoneus TaxID=556530 RepID=A0A2A9D2Y7_9MICO|nr:excisionase family DNA binding protein [Serinibacter salmoneus]